MGDRKSEGQDPDKTGEGMDAWKNRDREVEESMEQVRKLVQRQEGRVGGQEEGREIRKIENLVEYQIYIYMIPK